MEDGEATTPGPGVPSPSLAVSPPHENAEAGPSRPRKPRKPRVKKPPRPREKNPFGLSETRWYSTDLSTHAWSSRSLLDGRVRPFTRGVPEHDSVTGLTRSIVPPAAEWEVDEKNRLFAALARHSRLRPELIAADVGTKSVVQVERYLALLECANRDQPVHRRGRDERAYGEHHMRTGAYEASDAWVEREDGFAATIDRAREHEWLLNHPRDQHNFAEWGHSLSLPKMKLLHRTLCAAEQNADITAYHEEEEEEPDEEEVDNPIEKDNREITILEDIPSKERTPLERKRLSILKNRKRNRQNYRRKQLHAAGYTDEAINEHGGPDNFLEKAGFTITGGAPRKRVRVSRRSHSPETKEMVDLKLDGYLTRRGWDIFNFERLSEAMALYHSVTPTEPSTSMELIGEIFADVLADIRQLVYTTLVLAEQEPAGEPPNLEATAAHVRAALALRGAAPPATVLRAAVRRFSELAGDPDPEDAPDDRPSRASSRAPSDESLSDDSEAPSARQSKVSSSRHSSPQPDDDITSWQSLEKPLVIPPDNDGQDSYQQTLTDDEDEQLDCALEEADDALDVVMNEQLKRAADRNRKRAVVDDQVWFEHNRGRPKRKVEPQDLPSEDVERLRDAQDRYQKLVDEVFLARRKRKLARERSERSWHQGYLKGGRLRAGKHDAGISPGEVEDVEELHSEEEELEPRRTFAYSEEELIGTTDEEEDLPEWDETRNESGENTDDSLSSSEDESSPLHGDDVSQDGQRTARGDSPTDTDDIQREEDMEILEGDDALSSSDEEPGGSEDEQSSEASAEATLPQSQFDDVILDGDDALDSDSD